ncbi:hypothetical protein FOXG_21502 [Fusarium oxysporum f. sp. lycopersici 4287]|uniref:Uncharacterized protein n=2 Tax=Fusarium oxysporum TaxID=5507 RepID=A0A0J9VYF1_FUSO4|nr:hypothetical protein FOXG_21502 [Fusarium oxysporum f. sp. lycopersici 4287]EXK26572.1 hypothetical protein FOMG_16895 [Fusarium oxysporum f. sp. melonis 26406]KAI8416469.1 hypothetical protein FOFC_02779 [Fusarium oxysporum]KNB15828.1 hypothetical protein FOXG_21502 [Fusarium oxysporum f. sp. lycopersici 4287]
MPVVGKEANNDLGLWKDPKHMNQAQQKSIVAFRN